MKVMYSFNLRFLRIVWQSPWQNSVGLWYFWLGYRYIWCRT